MAGNGGHKHRTVKLHRKRMRARQKAKANIARVRKQFEDRGQAWDPKNNTAQMAALTHEGRRQLALTTYDLL